MTSLSLGCPFKGSRYERVAVSFRTLFSPSLNTAISLASHASIFSLIFTIFAKSFGLSASDIFAGQKTGDLEMKMSQNVPG